MRKGNVILQIDGEYTIDAWDDGDENVKVWVSR